MDYSQHTVLIIEDSEVYRQFLTTLLKKIFGANVVGFANPINGLDWLNNNIPSFIILDMELPQIDGYNILKKIRLNDKTEKVPVLVCTALNTKDLVVQLVKLGIVGYIDKRTDVKVIASKLKSIFETLE